MIPSEEKAWRLDVIKLRYEALNLTDEQAGLVHQYEQDKQGLFTAPSFSMWEEWDFEWATFREFLSEDQFALYEEQVQEERGGFEKELQARDGQEQHEIDYLEVMLRYYETELLPPFFEDHFLGFHWLVDDQSKIDYLRMEYRKFLQRQKRDMLVNHFRQNKTFMPNTLKVAKLRFQIDCLLPAYGSFIRAMDQPTKAVDGFMRERLRSFPEGPEQLLEKQFSALADFKQEKWLLYYGESKGWRVLVHQEGPEDERTRRIMTALLLEKGGYAG